MRIMKILMMAKKDSGEDGGDGSSNSDAESSSDHDDSSTKVDITG
jgi:hypothetical protein